MPSDENNTLDPNAYYFILSAVKRIYAELPVLVGTDAWNKIKPAVDDYIGTIETKPEAYLEGTQLYGLLAHYELARQRMITELKIQQVVTTLIKEPMEHVAVSLGIDPTTIGGLFAAAYMQMKWEVDPTSIPTAGDNKYRSITFKDALEGRSVKFKNIRLELGDSSKLMAGFATSVAGVIAAPAVPLALPILVTAGLLTTISALHGAMKIELTEQDTTVFRGMIEAVGTMRGAGLYESTIISSTTTVRGKYGLEPLNDAQVRYSLSKLERINVIEKTDGYYRIIETFAKD